MGIQAAFPASQQPHPLETELKDLIACDEKMWAFIQSGSLDGVWYWDLERPDQEWMSPEFWRLFGIDPATKKHDPNEWQDIIFKEDLTVAIENFQRHCEDPSHAYDQIVRYRHADGSIVWVRCRGIAIRDASGKPIRMLGAHNDLTAVKRAEEEAIHEKAKLEVANEELRSFAYGVSHDLKSPSRTAKQLIEEALYAGENLTKDQTELLGDACETLSRMQCLISDLLNYGQVVDQNISFETVDLGEVVQAVIDDLQSEIVEANARIDITELPVTQGDPVQLRMLIQNLIANAVKFRREAVDPIIRVTGDIRPDGHVVLQIEDNGLGIAEEYFDRIFHVFARLHRSDEIAGSGLGLALCRRIAMNHHGSIGLASEPGLGSTFTVDLAGSK